MVEEKTCGGEFPPGEIGSMDQLVSIVNSQNIEFQTCPTFCPSFDKLAC